MKIKMAKIFFKMKHIIKTLNIFSEAKSYPITGLDRPLGLQEVGAFKISRKSAHVNGKVVSPTVCLITNQNIL